MMITTSRLVPLDAVGRAEQDLIHLTGPLQVVARAEMDDAGDAAAQVDFRFDAARVRGVGLKTGARYWAQGVHQSRYHPGELPASFDLVGHFELLGCGPDGSRPTAQTLTVRFKVTVPPDGRVRVAAEDLGLLPGAGGSALPY